MFKSPSQVIHELVTEVERLEKFASKKELTKDIHQAATESIIETLKAISRMAANIAKEKEGENNE